MTKGDFHDFGDTSRYNDIMSLPHPEPKHHARMDAATRAAQFSPFAALTGYGEAVKEVDKLYNSVPEPVTVRPIFPPL